MALRTCIVSYTDLTCQRSVEVLAETLHEAVVLGIAAMKLPKDMIYNMSFDVKIKQPEVYRHISGAALNAWLARDGKDAKEQALKDRLSDLLRA